MNTLSTGIALVILSFLAFSGLFAALAWRYSQQALDARDEILSGVRKLQGLRDEHTALQARIDKLAGRVYAQTRRPPPEPVQNGYGDGDLDPDLAAELALQRAPATPPGK